MHPHLEAWKSSKENYHRAVASLHASLSSFRLQNCQNNTGSSPAAEQATAAAATAEAAAEVKFKCALEASPETPKHAQCYSPEPNSKQPLERLVALALSSCHELEAKCGWLHSDFTTTHVNVSFQHPARIRFSKERKCFSCARLLVMSAWCWLLEISILRNRLPSSQSGLARIVGRPCSGISYNARDAERPSQRWTCGSFRCGICLLTSSRSRSNGASVHTGIVGVVVRSYKSSN